MIISIYLHRPIVETLRCFGTLTEVVDKILSAGDDGTIDIMDKPPAPDRNGAGRYDIDVTNENYLSLLETFSINSPKISIRRLLYWFVDNEMYNELDWEISSNNKDKRLVKINKCITAINNEYEKLSILIGKENNMLEGIAKSINLLKESYSYDTEHIDKDSI